MLSQIHAFYLGLLSEIAQRKENSRLCGAGVLLRFKTSLQASLIVLHENKSCALPFFSIFTRKFLEILGNSWKFLEFFTLP